MRPYRTFKTRRDYTVPLLETLAALPSGRSRKSAVVERFAERFAERIPPAHREPERGGRGSLWVYWLGWQRGELLEAGMLDAPEWGVWQITAMGRRWLEDNPDKTYLNPQRLDARRGRGKDQKSAHAPGAVHFRIDGHEMSLTREHVLTVAREAIRVGLPPEASGYRAWAAIIDGHRIGLKWLFGKAAGAEHFHTDRARDILGRRLGIECIREKHTGRPRRKNHAADASSDEEAAWLDIARREARSVREFLAGRAVRPSDERLCDMVQFCYTFGLYQEACRVFDLVDRDAVNPWLYARTRKMAMVCGTKAAS